MLNKIIRELRVAIQIGTQPAVEVIWVTLKFNKVLVTTAPSLMVQNLLNKEILIIVDGDKAMGVSLIIVR
jgi:CO dehydrogenase/acetyl-CoA synthase alpha subunit